MIHLAPGDLQLSHEWLEKHRSADLLEFDVASGLPTKAIYNNPVYQVCVVDVREFFGRIAEMMEEQVEKNG
jgi:hypothetical protein